VDRPRRYTSTDEDSGRWAGFPFREGDIIISTRSKHGTTWLQMICALLVFRSQRLPARLDELSPWLDWLVEPRDAVWERLEAQSHRRFIKTHTPLDGLPIDDRATFLVGARHPLDAAVSLYYQGQNLDRGRLAALTGSATPDVGAQLSLPEWLVRWIHADVSAPDNLDSLQGVMWHLADAWNRRQNDNVMLVHYADLSADLDKTMRRIADQLGIATDIPQWPELVHAARFETMRARADELAPDHLGVLKDRQQFFRAGRSGSGHANVPAEEYDSYLARVITFGPLELVQWLHR
jgi:hypothetical protein